jgi:hypothetical protein
MDDLAANFRLYFAATGTKHINGKEDSLLNYIKSLGV